MVFSSGRGSSYQDPGRGRLPLGMLIRGCLHKPHSLFLSKNLYHYYFSRVIQLIRCMTAKHAFSMFGYLILVSFNALYAWDRDPRYNNNDFAMD